MPDMQRVVDKRSSLFSTGPGRVVLFAIAVYVIKRLLVPYRVHSTLKDIRGPAFVCELSPCLVQTVVKMLGSWGSESWVLRIL